MESATCCGEFFSEIFGLCRMWNNSPRELWNISLRSMWNEIRLFTFAKQIFHSGAISHGGAIFHSPKANFVEKSTHCLGRQMCAFFWWGMVDSDHRSQWQQIYSLPPLAAREIPHIRIGLLPYRMELVNGVEPSTCWLQISCSAIEPHQHSMELGIIDASFVI